MSKSFNFNHLYYFYIIAKTGSLTQASDYLAVTKPTLSHQLKHLEDYLNLKLFKRVGRKLELTSEGAQVFSHAERMFEVSEHMFKSLSKSKVSKKNRIVIGVTPTVSRSFTYKTLEPLFKSKTISPYLKEANFEFLLKELRNKKIDLIVSEATLNPSFIEGTLSTPLGSNEYLFVGNKKFKGKAKKFPQSIDGLPFFSFTSENSLRWEIEHYFSQNNVSVDVVGEADNIAILKNAVVTGLSITALPFWAVAEQLKSEVIFELGRVPHYNPQIVATYGTDADPRKIEKVLKMIEKSD